MIAPLPPPDLPVRVYLQAIDRGRNIQRRYRIDAAPDLFGHWIVELHWGRIGSRGQSRSVSFGAQADCARFVRATLRRRATAISRIGVEYQAV